MSLCLSNRMQHACALLLAVALVTLSAARGQSQLEWQELQTALQVAAQKIQALEGQVAASSEKSAALSQSAAAANKESDELRERYERLRGLLEGLGIAALENSTDQLQDRLLAAASDFRLAEESRQKLAQSLMDLSEAALQFAQGATNPDPALNERLSKSLASAEQVLVSASARAGDQPSTQLSDARIVSLKQNMGIAVLSVGSRDGVKPGMPFQVYREDRPIAKILVTEVRSSVSGAVVQELANASDPVRVGDRGRVDTSRSF